MQQNYEGIIIRNPQSVYEQKRTYNLMKLKPTKQDEYKIVGFVEEVSIHGELKDRLGAFICESDNSEVFTVGSGLTDSQREIYWKYKDAYLNKYILVKYQALTERGVPRFGTFIQIVDKNK